MRVRSSSWLLIPAVALALTSCVGEGAAAPSDTVDASADYVAVTDQQGSVDGFVGAADDAQVERCETDGAAWTAAGTVTNPEDSEQSYRIYVAFNENRDTRGLVQLDLPRVAAGATNSWKAEAPIGEEGLSCVLRVERFAPVG